MLRQCEFFTRRGSAGYLYERAGIAEESPTAGRERIVSEQRGAEKTKG